MGQIPPKRFSTQSPRERRRSLRRAPSWLGQRKQITSWRACAWRGSTKKTGEPHGILDDRHFPVSASAIFCLTEKSCSTSSNHETPRLHWAMASSLTSALRPGRVITRFGCLGAVFRVDQSWAAFVIRDSRANHTPVSIGQVNGQDTQVISGLKEGDQVILHPSDRIRDGGRISERPR